MGAIAEGLLAFVKPLLDQTDGSREELDKALKIGQICFNLAVLPEDQGKELLDEMRLSSGLDEEEFDAFYRSIVVPMVERHREIFPRLHQVDSRRSWESGLEGQSFPIAARRAEAHPGTDRYAPCPCNSGKKYKFCCGIKRR